MATQAVAPDRRRAGDGAGRATALAADRMSKPQTLSAVNCGALLVHQYEEYQNPGWFPGQFNRGLFKSDSPRNYPLNTNTGMCIDTAIAYPVYIAPVDVPEGPVAGPGPGPVRHVPGGRARGNRPRIAGDSTAPASWPPRCCTSRWAWPTSRPCKPTADDQGQSRPQESPAP